MIWKIWTILMVIFVGGVWLLAIPYSPEPILKTGTVIPIYRAMGMVPEQGKITVSEDIGHDVFEVPPTDAEHLKEAMATMNTGGQGMEGMAKPTAEGMAGMKTEDQAMEGMAKPTAEGMAEMKTEDQAMEGMAKPTAEGMAGMKTEGQAMEGMAKPTAEGMAGMKTEGQAMEGMAEKAGEHAEEGMAKEAGKHAEEGEVHAKEEEAGGHGGGSVAEGLVVVAQGTIAEVDAALAAKGLKVNTVAIVDMKEWGFETGMVSGMPGQRIRLKVRNTGNIPHEFMIMNGAAMNAVNYRLTRPDWNLLEHEALSEVPFIMPGDSVDLVVEIHKPGIWMYMCMFPYHMQLGMMGMLMTPDMMGKMDGMKM